MESVQDMSGYGDNQKVKYIAVSFVGKALTWWNSQIHIRIREAAVGMSWEDFKNLTREEFCPVNEMWKLETKFWNHAIVRAGHAAYTDRFHELARLVRGMVTATKPATIHNDMQKASTLIDKAIRNGSLKKNIEKRGSDGKPSRDRNVKDDNKRPRTGNTFVVAANPMMREYTGTSPKCTNCNLNHLPELPCRACFSYNRLRHLAKDCRVKPRMVKLVNARNPTAAHGACFECGRSIIGNWAREGAFMQGLEEARQDPNIMMGTFALNNHYATTLFDFGTDYSFVSTTFTHMIGIESSDLGFSYEIEIASEQLVEINKEWTGCPNTRLRSFAMRR
nr:hypothetical protein [Tanacetum cinerariifolium]